MHVPGLLPGGKRVGANLSELSPGHPCCCIVRSRCPVSADCCHCPCSACCSLTRPVLPHPTPSYPTLTLTILSYLTPSYPILPYPTLTYPILSYPILRTPSLLQTVVNRIGLAWYTLVLSLLISPTPEQGDEHPLMFSA